VHFLKYLCIIRVIANNELLVARNAERKGNSSLDLLVGEAVVGELTLSERGSRYPRSLVGEAVTGE
jgi:hypothetical protein